MPTRVFFFAIAMCGASVAAYAQDAANGLTAAQVMQRVIAATGATPPANTVDTLKAGDPNTVVTGIATTFMDTYAVLEQAVASGDNLIITHEPTFYNHLDDQAPLAGDPVQQQKLNYIREHHLVIWRFHDTWHLRQPDGILAAWWRNSAGGRTKALRTPTCSRCPLRPSALSLPTFKSGPEPA